MEGEINNFLFVWSVVFASLYYCHSIGRNFPSGRLRQVSIIPIACLFFLLPLKLNTLYLGATTAFFIGWLANFKLLLFAFGKGPLISSPPLSLSRFLALACLPIKFQDFKISNNDDSKLVLKTHKSLIYYLPKVLVLLASVRLCQYTVDPEKKSTGFCIQRLWSMFLYCVIIYVSLELLLAAVAVMTRALMNVDLEPQFDEPYMATSLQDFWGKRWNLMVSNILRPTVYLPVRSFSTVVVGKEFAAIPAVLATFLTSGLMHEYILYLIGRQKPTGEMTCFFLVNGILLAGELVIKKGVKGKLSPAKIVSIPLTLWCVLMTSFWMFFPPVLMSGGDLKACKETFAIVESIESRRLISPADVYCGS